MKYVLSILISLFTMLLKPQNVFAQVPFPKFDFEAHRGGRGLMPENTIAAMLHAMDFSKTTTLEMDLCITKDLKVVVSHDPILNKVITSDPAGNALQQVDPDLTIYQMNYATLATYDVGKRPNPRFPKKKDMATSIPLFADLVDSVEKKALTLHKSFWYNIEIKSVDGKDGLEHPNPNTFVELVMQIVKEKHIENRVVIQSFDIRPLQVLHEKYPNMLLSYLVEGKESKDVHQRIQTLGFVPFIYSSEYRFVDEAMIAYCHSNNIKVIPWTINNIADINQLIALHIDGYITDYPDIF